MRLTEAFGGRFLPATAKKLSLSVENLREFIKGRATEPGAVFLEPVANPDLEPDGRPQVVRRQGVQDDRGGAARAGAQRDAVRLGNVLGGRGAGQLGVGAGHPEIKLAAPTCPRRGARPCVLVDHAATAIAMRRGMIRSNSSMIVSTSRP